MKRKVLAQVWCEIDPTINVRIDRQSGQPQPDLGDQLIRVSPWGRANLAAALAIDNTEVTAVAVGAGHADALRHALAAGAIGAVALVSSGEARAAPSAAALAEWCRNSKPQLVIGDRTVGRLAAGLGWAHLAGVADLRIEGETLYAIRYLERGAREEVSARLPAAICLEVDAIATPYISRGRLRRVSLEQIQHEATPHVEESAVTDVGPLQQKRARTKAGKTQRSTSSRGADRLASLMQSGGTPAATQTNRPTKSVQSPDEMAEQFVRYLRHHDLL